MLSSISIFPSLYMLMVRFRILLNSQLDGVWTSGHVELGFFKFRLFEIRQSLRLSSHRSPIHFTTRFMLIFTMWFESHPYWVTILSQTRAQCGIIKCILLVNMATITKGFYKVIGNITLDHSEIDEHQWRLISYTWYYNIQFDSWKKHKPQFPDARHRTKGTRMCEKKSNG